MRLQPTHVIETVREAYGVDPRTRTRQPTVVRAREVAVYLMHNACKMSFPEIASALGYRSHSAAVDANTRLRRGMLEEGRIVLVLSVLERRARERQEALQSDEYMGPYAPQHKETT